ncbi:hypothetical protein BGZ67_000338, partial [Mortierella alpina]
AGEKTNAFSDIDADQLSLWRVDHPVIAANKHQPVLLDAIDSHTELDPTDDIIDVFEQQPPKKTIHIIVQRPPPGDLHVDIKKITDKFFAPGPIVDFLDAFVKGKGALPTTSGSIRGLPRAWRRGFGRASETRPSLLFMDLPDPSIRDSASRNLAAGSIPELVKQNNRA